MKPALSKDMRRGSSGSSMDENFLTVPQTVTASSSAETLTGFYVLSILFSIFTQCSKNGKNFCNLYDLPNYHKG